MNRSLSTCAPFDILQDHVKLAIELSEKMESSKPAHMAAFLKVSHPLLRYLSLADPGDRQSRICAADRKLFVSPFRGEEAFPRRPTKKQPWTLLGRAITF